MSQTNFSIWKMLAVLGVALSSVSVASILHEPPDVKLSLSQNDYGKERNLGSGGSSFSSTPKSGKIGKNESVSSSDYLDDLPGQAQPPPDVLKYETPLSPGEVKYDTPLPGSLKSPSKMIFGEFDQGAEEADSDHPQRQSHPFSGMQDIKTVESSQIQAAL